MQEVDISALSEGCVTHILSFTSPRDACSSSLVSLAFKSAADCDLVWEKFLPSDYNEILARSVSSLHYSSKKGLYSQLCGDPILLDGGNKSFRLEKKSGKKCFMIGARELTIVWGDTPHYWQWISRSDSRFAEVAYLEEVWWLEIRGKMETRMLSPKTTYAAYLVIKFDNPANGLTEPPTDASVEFVGGGGSASGVCTVYLDPEFNRSPHPIQRGDGWMEIEMGEFYNDQGEDGEVEMTLKEVAGHWKYGLIVQGIELRPKGSSST